MNWIKVSLAILLLLVAILPASAVTDQFNITPCPGPYWVGFVYPQQVYLWSYTFNSSKDIADANWSVYGSNNGQDFILFDNQTKVTFVNNTEYTFNLTCGDVYYKYYLIRFDETFSSCPVVTILFNTESYPISGGQPFNPTKDYPFYLSVLGVGGLVPVVFALAQNRKNRTGKP
jgi:hypothetical protein